MRIVDLAKFIIARDTARQNKEAGLPKPWTKDKILQQFRFCNVRREDDAVTRWIALNWRAPLTGAVDLFFAMTVARLFNNPDTLADIQPFVINNGTVKWHSERARKALRARVAAGKRVFNAAYIVSTNGMKMDKIEYVIDFILDPLWEARKLYRPKSGELLADYHKRLIAARGLGSFMAAQVIADLKYAPPYYDLSLGLPTSEAEDWYTFAASGPGSRRGLNRVLSRDADSPWREADWRKALSELQTKLLGSGKLPQYLGSYLHAQDLQNCLCEFDKYERIRLGQGRPKQTYCGAY